MVRLRPGCKEGFPELLFLVRPYMRDTSVCGVGVGLLDPYHAASNGPEIPMSRVFETLLAALAFSACLATGATAAHAQTVPPPDTPPPSPRIGEANADALFEAAYTLQSQGHFSSATALYKQVLQEDPDREDARKRLSECLAAQGYFDEASRIAAGGLVNPNIGASIATITEDDADDETVEVRVQVTEDKPPPARAATSSRPFTSNFRADQKLGFTVNGFGPTLGIGLGANYIPHWLLAVDAGFGGIMWPGAFGMTGAIAASFQAELMPIPFFVTPTIGAGFTWAWGSSADELPGYRVQPRLDQVRFMPYWSVGVRVDAPNDMFFTAAAHFTYDDRGLSPQIVPYPGFRVGFRL